MKFMVKSNPVGINGSLDDKGFAHFMANSLTLVKGCVKLMPYLVDEVEADIASVEWDREYSWEDVQLTKLEDFVNCIDAKNISTMQTVTGSLLVCSGRNSQRLRCAVDIARVCYDKCNLYVEDFIPLNAEQVSEIKDEICAIFKNLNYTLVKVFDITKTSETLSNSEGVEVARALYDCYKHVGDLSELVKMCVSLSRMYIPDLKFYEDDNEKLDKLLSMVDEEVYDWLLDNEDVVTQELLDKILAGDIPLNRNSDLIIEDLRKITNVGKRDEEANSLFEASKSFNQR